MSPHLRPTAAIAPIALLPGDPGRALALAQALLERPLMCNHHRGLWGYSGTAADGRELTIQSTGIGAPSAAIVLAELAAHGVRRAVRIGTCTAIDRELELGTAIAAEGALRGEAASRSLSAGGLARPDRDLHRRLLAAAGDTAVPAVVASVEVLSDAPGLEQADAGHDGAAALEMGTATLFALGARLGVEVASALVVAARLRDPAELDDPELERRSLELGAFAARALGG